jgi:HSP20 family molecular chaperone IbpA
MATPKTALSGSSKAPQILSEEQHSAFHDRLRQSISERAYDIYQGDGQHGNDFEHWIQAENEVLQHGLEVRESGSWLALNATIPDGSLDNVEVCLTPNSISVHASKQESTQNAESESFRKSEHEIFLTQDLKVEIEPATASATLKDQKLTIMVKKRYPVSTGATAASSEASPATSTTIPATTANPGTTKA